jgi:sensor histidine kinase YesM
MKSSNHNGLLPNSNRQHLQLTKLPFHLFFWGFLALFDFLLLYSLDPALIVLPNIAVNFIFVILFFYGLVSIAFPRFSFQKSPFLAILSIALWVFLFIIIKWLFFKSLIGLKIPFKIFLLEELARSFHLTILAFLYFLLISYLKERKLKILFELEKVELDLSFSKLVLSPHFIFNCLSSISADFYSIAREPSRRISELAQLMNYSLDKESKYTSIKEDLSQISKFIEFQKFRFNNELNLKFLIETGKFPTENFMIPRMVLLTLVENIFKHGDSQNSNSPIIIKAALSQDDVSISPVLFSFSTSNPINQGIQYAKSTGIGLKTINKILSHYFGHDFSLSSDINDNIFTVNLLIKYHGPIQNHAD